MLIRARARRREASLAYATGYTDDSYQVASAASEIWLNPLGLVAIAGPGSQHLYYKGLLDKLGVTAHVYRVGTYKAAVEPFIRSDMSPEARENAQALGNALLESWRESVLHAPSAGARSTTTCEIHPRGSGRRRRHGEGFAERRPRRQDRRPRSLRARLAQLGGSDDRSDRRIQEHLAPCVRSRDPGRSKGGTDRRRHDRRHDRGRQGGLRNGRRRYDLRDHHRGLADNDLKALVVRVDSPGGSVLASERIRQAILEAKRQKLPVVVSMGSVAASGGYWVSTPGRFHLCRAVDDHRIDRRVRDLAELRRHAGKLGIGADGIKTTPLSGEPDVLNGPSPEAEQLLQTGVDSIYGRFLGIVAQSRHKTPQQIDAMAQGRVWDGGTAHQLGLVDGFGGMDEAIAEGRRARQAGEATTAA